MPPSRPKPSDIAAEAKRRYIPYIEQNLPNAIASSFVHTSLEKSKKAPSRPLDNKKLRVAVIDGDCVDVALDWFEEEFKSRADAKGSSCSGSTIRIPVVNMANEKRAGGDWESGLLAPEENLSRRSNLVRCLTKPWSESAGGSSNYPIPLTGGIYSPSVVVFRSGMNRGYDVWHDFKWLPVISVAPMRRPKLDTSGQDYAFEQEKELMKEKIRTVLRIAVAWNHRDVCIGAFGAGPVFRNPVQQLALMWKEILFTESEFIGMFSNIVFAVEQCKERTDSSTASDYEIFKKQFDASNVCKTVYR